MGRHCAQRRKGTSLSGETTPPDPFDSQNLQTYADTAKVSVVVTRDTDGDLELWDITSVPVRVVQFNNQSMSVAGPNEWIFGFVLEAEHNYECRTRCQFYPFHVSNQIP